MTPVPNQPVVFNYAPDCNLTQGEWASLVMEGDITGFQFEIGGCATEPDLIHNGLFNLPDTDEGWAINPPSSWIMQPFWGQIYHVPGSTVGTAIQTLIVSDGILMQLSVRIVQTVGSVTITIGNYVHTITGTYNGVFTDWIIADGVSTVSFAVTTASDATIGSVSLIPYNTEFQTDIIDLDGNIINSGIPFNVFNGWATFSLDWFDSVADTNGCYRIRVYDPCLCGQFGLIPLDLTTGVGTSAVSGWAWAIGDRWALGSGLASYVGTSAPDTSTFRLKNAPYCVGTEYTVTYTIDSIVDAQVRVSMGGANGTWQTAVGSYSETITPTVSGSLIFTAQSVGSPGVVIISGIRITAVTPEYSWESEVFKYGEWDACHKEIRICNDSDAMGMGFVGTGFSPWVRTRAHVRGTGYNSERNKYRDGFGNSKVYWGTSLPVKDLAFDAPEYIHDFVRLGLIADHFYVDSDEYEVEADEYPTMGINMDDDLSGVALPIVPKSSNTMNRRISSVVRGCSPDGQAIGVIGRPIVTGGTHGSGKPLATTDGEVIIIDG